MKPSIFSKDYKKSIQKRKKIKKIISFVLVILVLFFGTYYILNKKSKISFNINLNMFKKSSKVKSGSKNSTSSNTKSSNTKTKNKTVEKSYDVKLPDDQTIKAYYDETSNNKAFKFIEGGSNIKYNINSSGSKVVICDSIQNMIILNINGNTEDITKKNYTSSDGTVFLKDDILKNTADYIWCSDAKFIDDNTILYLSYLPWFNGQSIKYVWLYNITDKTHTGIQSVYGTNVIEGDIDASRGMKLTVDNNVLYVNSSGNVTN